METTLSSGCPYTKVIAREHMKEERGVVPCLLTAFVHFCLHFWWKPKKEN